MCSGTVFLDRCVTAAAVFLGFSGSRLFDTRSPWDCSKSKGLSSYWYTHLDVGCLLSLGSRPVGHLVTADIEVRFFCCLESPLTVSLIDICIVAGHLWLSL